MSLILSTNSAVQSYLHDFGKAAGVGPVTVRHLLRTVLLYLAVWSIGTVLAAVPSNDALQAFGLGLVAPGAGFLRFAGNAGVALYAAMALTLAGFSFFLIAMVVWLATGNVVLVPVVWVLASLAAASAGVFIDAEAAWHDASALVPAAAIAFLLSVIGAAVLRRRGSLRVEPQVAYASTIIPTARPSDDEDEMSAADIARLRLLLDRALQPIDAFDGFEWRDQFQTAAIRYQLNFMSYALSFTQRTYAPACKAYFAQAQANLIAKQQDPRVWRYWELESLWGHLARNPDPMARDNIMFSGFVAAQVTLAIAAGGLDKADGRMTFRHRSGRIFTWTPDEVIDNLVRQYSAAPYGLLACEPNWIYPLCNTITAVAIRARDAQTGTEHWAGLADRFKQHLEAEFTLPSGQLVPFRSSLTGLAGPQVGGAVMQAFPCLFLNATLPELAERQWGLVRHDLKRLGARRAHWPVDVGNYRFSRASSYAATAAAAVEMGDHEVADELLARLEADCAATMVGGVSHRPDASLWAHAVEIMARSGRGNALRRLVATGKPSTPMAPFLKEASYPDVLIAKCVAHGEALQAVLDPACPGKPVDLTVGGLIPDATYRIDGDETLAGQSDHAGELRFTIAPRARIPLAVRPVR